MRKSYYFYLLIIVLLVVSLLQYSGALDLPFLQGRPVFTPQEIEELLYMRSNNQRAGVMVERGYKESMDDSSTTLYYHFRQGWIEFSESNIDACMITLYKKSHYEKFMQQFKNFKSLSSIEPCLTLQSNDKVYICDLGYNIVNKGYGILISKTKIGG